MVEVLPTTETDYGDIVAVWNAVWPDLPIEVEELKHGAATIKPHERPRYWLAKLDGQAVGLGELGPVPGSYHPQHWSLHIAVPEANRHKGFGNKLYDTVRSAVGPQDPLSIASMCKENDSTSLAFLSKRGYVETKRDFQSMLDLQAIDLSVLQEIERRPLPEGVRLVTLAELDSPAFRVALHDLFEEVRKDIPRLLPPTPMTHDEFIGHVLEMPFLLKEGSLAAITGDEIVGFTWEFRGVDEGRLDQGLTAVRKDYRGRGLAAALKAKAMRWAIQQGYRYVRTDNDTRNAAMIAINDRLGFTRLPATISMQWSAL